ncbi:MAG: sigma-54 dependent transcriptional regulator [Proteobacteria bacterium]|nr:sigma-54 dependent transcriptional regulator [Pseudomonadota bacterium]MBU1638919.1 sigma-54 dependent transcriptional regulator [Pseudomonadota bacterium]
MTEELRRKILILDDEPNMRHMLTVLVEKAGYQVTTGADGREGLDLLGHHRFDFILCDIKMPNMSGMEFLQASSPLRGEATVIMMSAYGAIDTAIEAMKMGAYDFISKPFKTDEVLLTLKKAEERENLKRENRSLKLQISEVKDDYRFGTMLAHSKAMRDVFRLAAKVAQFDTTVLVTGESGTGKELVARGIHFASARAKMPLVVENCGCVPENLLESLFFGHVKGAFTGADHDKKGLFEEADKGTIFLDEIGDLPLLLQVKLLRVLQEGEIRPVGASQAIHVDVRVIAATARDLASEVKEGRFRQDLYYRLNVLPITLPPLRSRPADIPLLCEHFIAKLKDRMGLVAARIDKDAMKMLLKYQWPGNVRELENTIERALVLADGDTLLPENFPMLSEGTSPCGGALFDGYSLKDAKKVWEKNLIEKTLAECKGNRSRAAEMLEISYPSLLSKIKEYGVEV